VIEGRLYHTDRGLPLLPRVLRTSKTLERLCGLLGRRPLRAGEGLLIDPCRSIHTLGMRYAIDVIYLDREWRVAKLVHTMKPWRLSACWRASMTLEVLADTARALGITEGATLRWELVPDSGQRQ
jgi:uncharacterized membrane protein (UPF0127 family)